MKYPLDKLCVKTRLLCPSCLKKVESRVVDETDIEVIRLLVELEDSVRELKKGEYVKALRVGDETLVIVKNGYTATELDNLSRTITEKTNVKIRFILDPGDKMKLIERILHPYRVLSITTVYLPTGDEHYIVRVEAPSFRERRRCEEKLGGYVKVIESILGKHVKFMCEGSV